MKGKPLTPIMLEAIKCAREHDGKLVRYPGGFWSHEGWRLHSGIYYGTTTIEGLVTRNAGTYTKWQERRDGSKFPIEVTVKP